MTDELSEKAPLTDQRKSPRRRVLKAGLIAFNDRHSTLQCTVRDLSETGARLLIGGSIGAPDTFELLIELDGLEHECTVVSRAAGEVRVKFLGPARHVPVRRVQVVNPVALAGQPSLRRKPRPLE
jgi:hypothetical protein